MHVLEGDGEGIEEDQVAVRPEVVHGELAPDHLLPVVGRLRAG